MDSTDLLMHEHRRGVERAAHVDLVAEAAHELDRAFDIAAIDVLQCLTSTVRPGAVRARRRQPMASARASGGGLPEGRQQSRT